MAQRPRPTPPGIGPKDSPPLPVRKQPCGPRFSHGGACGHHLGSVSAPTGRHLGVCTWHLPSGRGAGPGAEAPAPAGVPTTSTREVWAAHAAFLGPSLLSVKGERWGPTSWSLWDPETTHVARLVLKRASSLRLDRVCRERGSWVSSEGTRRPRAHGSPPWAEGLAPHGLPVVFGIKSKCGPGDSKWQGFSDHVSGPRTFARAVSFPSLPSRTCTGPSPSLHLDPSYTSAQAYMSPPPRALPDLRGSCLSLVIPALAPGTQ